MLSEAESIASLPPQTRQAALDWLTEEQCAELLYDWRFNGRPEQLLPGTPGAALGNTGWLFWLILAGRGFGKTRTGAETVREWATNPQERILMIAPTAGDVRDTMIEGVSGLLQCFPPNNRPSWEPSKRRILFPSGAIGITRSADEPERLRGPQFTKFWADELCAWRFLQEAWDQIMFGFRVKTSVLQGVITTTPKPSKLLTELVADPSTVITRGSSYDNRRNLADAFIKRVIAPYEGTRLGRQEINAEILTDTPGALWTAALIDETRIKNRKDVVWDRIVRVVVGVDPAVTAEEGSDETGIVVAALLRSQHVLVLDDLSLRGSPLEWAKAATSVLKHPQWPAERIVAEVNNGGDLVEANIRTAVPNAPFSKVWAARGKMTRAEPIAAAYEQKRVHHVGVFSMLEAQMTTYVPGVGKSPDRMDALVYAITELLFPQPVEQRVQMGGIEQISPI
jgi:phage terminase large subunit-like protein